MLGEDDRVDECSVLVVPSLALPFHSSFYSLSAHCLDPCVCCLCVIFLLLLPPFQLSFVSTVVDSYFRLSSSLTRVMLCLKRIPHLLSWIVSASERKCQWQWSSDFYIRERSH